MSAPPSMPPITKRVAPAAASEAAEVVRECYASATPVYPLGGETSLNFGLPPKSPGMGLSLQKLDRVVDFPARDMTITVEAGVTMQKLAEIVAQEGLQLPIDAPFPDRATIGGVIASGWNGPRRYGYGLIRDYVIGVHAIDGTGREFKAGGRVVKNVAGYDFCKLLTGSIGTLGVITEATLKLKPITEAKAWAIAKLSDLAEADAKLESLVHFPAVPSAICLQVQGCNGSPTLSVGLEGTEEELRWSLAEFANRIGPAEVVKEEYDRVLSELAHFPANDASPLVIRAAVLPSEVVPFIEAVQEVDSAAQVLACAGSGVIYVQFSDAPAGGLTKTLVGGLQVVAQRGGGHIVILSNPSGSEMTHQACFGGEAEWRLQREVKRKFDPKNLLNPGRLFPT